MLCTAYADDIYSYRQCKYMSTYASDTLEIEVNIVKEYINVFEFEFVPDKVR
jgi:hypothetical protein